MSHATPAQAGTPQPRTARPRTPQPGPVAPVATGRLAQRPLPASDVRLDAAGYLGRWQRLNAEATLPHCVAMLEDSGALANLRRVVGEQDGPFVGYQFADSDVYKVLEAIGWEIGRTGTQGWDGFLADTLDLLERAQDEDGYLNSFVQVDRPSEKFTDLRWAHELYCFGHLIQAAVALHRGAGREDYLALARRSADLLVRRFGPDGEAGYCGHPEVETALVELYRETGHEPYLATARRMVDERGQALALLGPDRLGAHYFQDHAPVRASLEATGHAVRQLYLNAGVTDVYTEQGDDTLLAAMDAQWDSAHHQKMYVTGAMGSRHFDESFGDAYELPPDRAYAETCAAIADVHWSYRMLLAEGGSRYADAIERALYNAVAASVSSDGCSFFYSNPLHLREGHREEENAPSRRTPWYSCACCPPNIARLVASLHAYVATAGDDALRVHLYSAATIAVPEHLGTGVVRVDTAYPAEGRVLVEVEGELTGRLALRVPGWARSARATVDGEPVGSGDGTLPTQDGYLVLPAGTQKVELDLDMPATTLAAHPRVDAVRGSVAIVRGPVVYCVEQADHLGGPSVEDVRLQAGGALAVVPGDGPLPRIEAQGVAAGAGEVPLYRDGRDARGDGGSPVRLTAIPYAQWGNRETGAMRVWLPVA
jgi:DUF1680 family protein